MATPATATPAPTPIKKAKTARKPLTKAEAAAKISGICKRLNSSADSLRVLDAVRAQYALDS